jgi:hypothetical protein
VQGEAKKTHRHPTFYIVFKRNPKKANKQGQMEKLKNQQCHNGKLHCGIVPFLCHLASSMFF